MCEGEGGGEEGVKGKGEGRRCEEKEKETGKEKGV